MRIIQARKLDSTGTMGYPLPGDKRVDTAAIHVILEE
jgi:hypothetical protein